MQPRDEMVRTGQVLLEANACHEQQFADVVSMVKMRRFSVNLKIVAYRIRNSTLFSKQSQQAMSSSFADVLR